MDQFRDPGSEVSLIVRRESDTVDMIASTSLYPSRNPQWHGDHRNLVKKIHGTHENQPIDIEQSCEVGSKASRKTNLQEGASSNYSTVELYTNKKMVEELQMRNEQLLKRLVEMEPMTRKEPRIEDQKSQIGRLQNILEVKDYVIQLLKLEK